MTLDKACVTCDGSSDEDWNMTGTGRLQFRNADNVKIYQGTSIADFLLCSIAPKGASSGTPDVIYSQSGNLILYLNNFKDGTLADWKTWLASNPIQIAYELATPQEITLTPTQIRTLQGSNTITTDADTLSVEYITQDYQPLVDLIEEGGGSSTHTYSTDEQVVGTWIDGSVVYEKTLYYETLSQYTSDWTTLESNTNIDTIINMNYNLIAYNGQRQSSLMHFAVQMNGTDLRYYSTLGSGTATNVYITLRYTKTTASRSLNTSSLTKSALNDIPEELLNAEYEEKPEINELEEDSPTEEER